MRSDLVAPPIIAVYYNIGKRNPRVLTNVRATTQNVHTAPSSLTRDLSRRPFFGNSTNINTRKPNRDGKNIQNRNSLRERLGICWAPTLNRVRIVYDNSIQFLLFISF